MKYIMINNDKMLNVRAINKGTSCLIAFISRTQAETLVHLVCDIIVYICVL